MALPKLCVCFAVRVLNCSGSGTNSGVISGGRLGDRQSHQSGGGEYEPRRRSFDSARYGSEQLDQFRCDLCNRGWELERQCCKPIPRTRGSCHHRRILNDDRRSVIVLKLRQRCRYICAGFEHTLGVEWQRHRHRNTQRNFDGDSSRSRRRCPVPAEQSGRLSRNRKKRDR